MPRSYLSQVKSIWTRETHTLAASSESLDSSLQEDLRIGLYEGAGTLSFFTLGLAAYRYLSSAVDDPNIERLAYNYAASLSLSLAAMFSLFSRYALQKSR